MQRLLATTCLFVGVAFAQLPGQYPGQGQQIPGQYPGQRPPLSIPGQRQPQGRSTPAPQSRTSTSRPLELRDTSGILRRLERDQIIIESTDHRVVWFRIGDTVKLDREKFQPGDHLVVSSNEDEEGNYTAISVQWESKGSAEDRAAAVQTWDLPGHVLAPAESKDERPKLTRAKPSDSAPAATPEVKDEQPQLASVEDKNERPKLVRGKPTATPPAQTTEPSDERPTLIRPQAPEASQSRTVAIAAPEPDAEVDEAPRTDRIRTGAMPTRSDDPAIANAREAAATFIESLPRFSVKQNTTRYIQEQARAQWRALDVVQANLVYKDGGESYTDIRVNNKPTNKPFEEVGGLHSTGEFGTIMINLFDPESGTIFTRPTQLQLRGRKAWKYDFSVIRTRSELRIETPSQLFYAPYVGTVWIDFETSRVLRLEMQATELPKAFPFDTVEMNIDYDYIRLDSSKQFLLPTESEALNCIRGTPVCMKNSTSFRNYVKFDVQSDIIFDAPQ
ncbi:MAG: hypothetical protein ABI972_28420 [Acidobacteriota bacterium]